jgi:hypothetical protein
VQTAKAKAKKRALTDEEKTIVKQNIVELIVHVPPVVRSANMPFACVVRVSRVSRVACRV